MKETVSVPRRYAGEGTWLGYFKTKNIIYTLIGSIIGMIYYYSVILYFKSTIGGMVGSILIIGAFYAFGSFKIPDDNFKSGGDDLDTVVYRRLKKIKKVIFIDKKGMLKGGC